MSDELRRMRDEVALLGRSIDDARAEHALGETRAVTRLDRRERRVARGDRVA